MNMKIDQGKLYDAMADKGIFVKDICKRVHITEYQLNRMLSGDTDLGTASRIAYVLNIKVDDLALDKGDVDE